MAEAERYETKGFEALEGRDMTRRVTHGQVPEQIGHGSAPGGRAKHGAQSRK